MVVLDTVCFIRPPTQTHKQQTIPSIAITAGKYAKFWLNSVIWLFCLTETCPNDICTERRFNRCFMESGRLDFQLSRMISLAINHKFRTIYCSHCFKHTLFVISKVTLLCPAYLTNSKHDPSLWTFEHSYFNTSRFLTNKTAIRRQVSTQTQFELMLLFRQTAPIYYHYLWPNQEIVFLTV